MAKYTIEDSTLRSIANAIRSKEGTNSTITVRNFPQRILNIQTGIDTSDATLTEAGALDGEIFYANGVKKFGTMSSYGPGTNDISMSWTGNTSSLSLEANIPEGHYEHGLYSIGDLPAYDPDGIVTPGTTDIEMPGETWYFAGYTIKGDANLVASNIKSGVSIFGIEGSLEEVNIDTELATQTSLLTQIEAALTAKGA